MECHRFIQTRDLGARTKFLNQSPTNSDRKAVNRGADKINKCFIESMLGSPRTEKGSGLSVCCDILDGLCIIIVFFLNLI